MGCIGLVLCNFPPRNFPLLSSNVNCSTSSAACIIPASAQPREHSAVLSHRSIFRLPSSSVIALRAAAARHGRSLSAQLRAVLSAPPPPSPCADFRRRLATLRGRCRGAESDIVYGTFTDFTVMYLRHAVEGIEADAAAGKVLQRPGRRSPDAVGRAVVQCRMSEALCAALAAEAERAGTSTSAVIRRRVAAWAAGEGVSGDAMGRNLALLRELVDAIRWFAITVGKVRAAGLAQAEPLRALLERLLAVERRVYEALAAEGMALPVVRRRKRPPETRARRRRGHRSGPRSAERDEG